MPKRSLPACEKVSLPALLRSDDLPLTLRWRNQDQIRRWFFFSDLIAPEEHANWFEQYRGATMILCLLLRISRRATSRWSGGGLPHRLGKRPR
jgi:hypothetical protein